MPFKSLTTPRRVADLNAEVRASAYLVNPGLVAMLSTAPVRLVVQPFGGTSARTTNIGLDGAEDVALLSRDVALVRSSDDAVWALVDITHTAKTEQVGRDMRALCMRPDGESALALGWDGSATLFTLDRHDVEARQFSLRGAVRACDLTESETYVVVDGDGGGELRIHGGATPESGATARCALPREARSFDRARCGPKLCAVYKRGGRTACLITGGPGRLSAKLVHLDAVIGDLAVLDTSLFAAFADGRAVLYNAEAISRSEDGPLEPKSTVALGMRGEPRTLSLPRSGAPVMWVGSSAGDVVSAGVIRKTAG